MLAVVVPLYLWATSVTLTVVETSCQDWTAHPSGDCSRYVRCFGDMRTVFVKKCPANLYFNPLLRVCDWPWNVPCADNKPSLPPTTPTGRHTHPSNCDYPCPEGVEWGRFPSLVSNCRVFYECERGHCSIGQCPEGLLFSALVLSCDLPQNTVCPNFAAKPECSVE